MERATLAIAALVAASLSGCGGEEAEPPGESQGNVAPYDQDAQMRPDLLELTPSPASQGQAVEVRFPKETQRGVPWVLEEQDGDTWRSRWFLTAAAEGYDAGGVPNWQAADDPAGFGWGDVGISGPGPDTLAIPDEATPGTYRLCTVNSTENICTALEIVP